MKISKNLLMGMIFVSILISSMNIQLVTAKDMADPDRDVSIDGDSVKDHIKAHERVRFQFRKRTSITIQGNTNISVDIQCDANNIGDKDFQIEINSSKDLELKMVCNEEEKELGLLKGNTYQVRNRNRYRYQEGFCVNLECNGTCNAKLMLEATEQNKNGVWAYYDESKEEWVSVETTVEDGYLVAETNHFSTWTVLVPEVDYTIYLIIGGISAAAIIGIIIILRKRNK
ncbi:MAG: hypothetical protein ACTSQP_03640 [Promethearchaeota archaeon]